MSFPHRVRKVSEIDSDELRTCYLTVKKYVETQKIILEYNTQSFSLEVDRMIKNDESDFEVKRYIRSKYLDFKKLELINALRLRVSVLYDSFNDILYRDLTDDVTIKIRFICCANNILQSSQISGLRNWLHEYYPSSYNFTDMNLLPKEFRSLVSAEDPTDDDLFEVARDKVSLYVNDKDRLLTMFNANPNQHFTFNHFIIDLPDLEPLSESRKEDFGRFLETLKI